MTQPLTDALYYANGTELPYETLLACIDLAAERWKTLDISARMPYDDKKSIALAAAVAGGDPYVGIGAFAKDNTPVAFVCGFFCEHPFAAGRIAAMQILVSAVDQPTNVRTLSTLCKLFEEHMAARDCVYVDAGPDVATRVPLVERFLQRCGYQSVGVHMQKELR